MKRLHVNEMLKLIEQKKTFEATTTDGAFTVKLNRYVPYCCLACHDGNNIRADIKDKLALDNYEIWYEEDPFTGDFIKSLPISITVHDSRFEYDLNRHPDWAIYEEAWGKKIWAKKLTVKERQISLKKHADYYKVLMGLIGKLESVFNGCLVYDLHAYNYKRWNRNTPLFNIGSERIDRKRFAKIVEHWKNELSLISVPGITNITAENDVFHGRGYNLEFLTKTFRNTLVLATEVKKVYCNELTGEYYPEIIKLIQTQLKKSIINNTHLFTKKFTNWDSKLAVNLLGKKEDPKLFETDKQLYKYLKNFELLTYVNPINAIKQKKKFLKSKFTEEPVFKYSPIKINPYELKQRLSTIKTKAISDVSIRYMYESVISAYFDKVDLLSELNSHKFRYNSLRYFQRPSKKDIKNAEYLMHLPTVPFEPKTPPLIPIEDVLNKFKNALSVYGLSCRIELSNRIVSQAMVLNSNKTICIRKDAKFTEKQVNALIEHEIGVHMVTTENSLNQKLKIFNLGLPVNTETQEGLAILSEILSGNITLERLKKIALRVLVTDMMCNGATFNDVFNFLYNDHQINTDEAFTITTRVFRGGGLTKDYLYLSGLVKIMKFWKDGNDLSPLMVGKTSLSFYDLIFEMIEREMVSRPKFITKSILNNVEDPINGLHGYILSGLKS